MYGNRANECIHNVTGEKRWPISIIKIRRLTWLDHNMRHWGVLLKIPESKSQSKRKKKVLGKTTQAKVHGSCGKACAELRELFKNGGNGGMGSDDFSQSWVIGLKKGEERVENKTRIRAPTGHLNRNWKNNNLKENSVETKLWRHPYFKELAPGI